MASAEKAGCSWPHAESVYRNSRLSVNVQGRTGQNVPSQTGLSSQPHLFGLFADGLHRYLLARCPGRGPLLSDGRRIPDLGYADDFVLLANSLEGLQELIDATADFCAATGMQISTDKTKVLVFSQVWPGPYQWMCAGQPLEWVAQMKYLGLLFRAQQGMHVTYSHLHSKMWGAWALLQRQFQTPSWATALCFISLITLKVAQCLCTTYSFVCF